MDDLMFVDEETLKQMDESSDEENEKGEEEKKIDSDDEKNNLKIDEEEFVEDDESKFQYKGHKDFVMRLHQNPVKSEYFVSGGGDDLAMIWGINKESPILTFPKNEETVDCVRFSNDGKFLAVGCLDSTLKIYDD